MSSRISPNIVDPAGVAAASQAGGYEAYLEANKERFLRLHVETELVLQIGLTTGRFSPGRYVCPGYSWVSADDPQAGAVHHFLAVKPAGREYVCWTVHGTARHTAAAAGISPRPGWQISEPAEPGMDGASPAAAALRADVLARGWDVVYHQSAGKAGGRGRLVEYVGAANPDSRSYEEQLLEADFIDGQPERPVADLLMRVKSRPRPHCTPASASVISLSFLPPGGAGARAATRAPARTARPGKAGDRSPRRPAGS